jgi:hypothetical protein
MSPVFVPEPDSKKLVIQIYNHDPIVLSEASLIAVLRMFAESTAATVVLYEPGTWSP